MPLNSGFVYVVNSDKYLQECLASYRSLRTHMADVRVAIVAHPQLFADIPGIEWVPLTREYDSPILKVEAYNAPFDRCVFLDSDTRVVRDIRLLFDVLEGFDLALAHEPTRGWDYDAKAARVFCELNTGVIVFRKSPKVEAFFQRWTDLYFRMRAEQGLVNDQPSFRDTLWASHDIRHMVLPSEFHLVTLWANALYWHAHILHGREDLEKIEAAINARVGSRAFLPEFGSIYPYRGRKSLLRNYLGMSVTALRTFLNPSAALKRMAPPGDWQARAKKEQVAVQGRGSAARRRAG